MFHACTVLATVEASGPGDSMLQTLVVILAAAGVVAVVAQRLRLAMVPAYLITGALIGPSLLGIVPDRETVGPLANLAIVLLMFGIGLHFDLGALRGSLARLLGVAAVSIVGSILLLWPAAMLLGVGPWTALTVAMAMSLSSTAVVMRLMQRRREMHRSVGRLSLSILVAQDLAVIAMLLVLPLLATLAGTAPGEPDAEAASIGDLAGAAAVGLLGIAAICGVGRLLLPRLLREAARTGSGETLVVLSVAFAIGAAAATVALGMSAELGAFLGGFLLSNTPFRHALSGQIATIRDLFIAVFFTVVGTEVDIPATIEHWPVVVLGTVLLLGIKAVLIGVAAWSFGARLGVAGRVGLTLAQAGEFGIVILQAGNAAEVGLVSDVVLAELTAITVLSLVATPGMIALGARLDTRLKLHRAAPWIGDERLVDPDERREAPTEPTGEDPPPHVIVAGFGVVGRAVVDRLCDTDASITVVETNIETVRAQRQSGKSFVYGDVSDPEVLEHAGVDRADVLALTVPDEAAVIAACRAAKSLNPNVFVIARTGFLSRAMQAIAVGADETVVEELATAESMDRLVHGLLDSRLSSARTPQKRDASPRKQPAGEAATEPNKPKQNNTKQDSTDQNTAKQDDGR